jgi:outer membrane assembly lipoprotein YfiO
VINTRHTLRLSSCARLCVVAVALAAAGACASAPRSAVPAGTIEPDKFLFDKGTEALNKKKWLTAREFFKQVTETYTASPYRPDAKLGIGDTYLGEGSSEALVLAINEFSEFLSFYPTNRRADYAQYKLGMGHFRQMRLA